MKKITNFKQQAAASTSLEAAAFAIKENLTNQEASNRFGIGRHSVTCARIILMYGTPDDAKLVELGTGVSTVAEAVKRKMTVSQMAELKNRIGGPPSANVREKQKTSSSLWSKFNPMLLGLTELPSPEDMIKIINGNTHRKSTVNEQLGPALKWLQEFSHAWNEHKRDKRQDSPSDAGRSNEDA